LDAARSTFISAYLAGAGFPVGTRGYLNSFFWRTVRHAARKNSLGPSREEPPSLAPVSFYEHVAAATVDPTGRNPPGVLAWRLIPPAFLPHIVVPVPPVVARHPDVSYSPRTSTTALGGRSFTTISAAAAKPAASAPANTRPRNRCPNITFSTSAVLDAASHAAVYRTSRSREFQNASQQPRHTFRDTGVHQHARVFSARPKLRSFIPKV